MAVKDSLFDTSGVDAENPFGDSSVALASPRPPVGGAGFGKVTGRKTSGKHDLKREQYARIADHMAKGKLPPELAHMRGGFAYKVDRTEITYVGKMIKVDLLGFMDMQAVKSGKVVGIQITSLAQIGDHVREYTNPKKTHGQAKTPVLELLRKWIELGCEFWIAGYHQLDRKDIDQGCGFWIPSDARVGNWAYKWVKVTPEMLEEFIARKRKK